MSKLHLSVPPNIAFAQRFAFGRVKVAERKTSAASLRNLNPPTGSGRQRGAVYLCRGLFVPLKNVEHPLWLFRPSKKLLIHLRACSSKHRHERLWLWMVANYREREKKAFFSNLKHVDSKANKCSSVARRGRSRSRKKAGLGRMVVMCQLPHDSKWPVLAAWAKLLRNREDNAAQYLSRHQCGNARHLAV